MENKRNLFDVYDNYKIEFRKLHSDAIYPQKGTDFSVGLDVRSVEEILIGPGSIAVIPTGLQAIFSNKNMELQVRTRSGSATKGVIVANSPGTIDPDYTGEIKVILYNTSKTNFAKINKHDRIAQLVPVKIDRDIVIEPTPQVISREPRTDKGFGSSGVK